jgi:hypothetical protein
MGQILFPDPVHSKQLVGTVLSRGGFSCYTAPIAASWQQIIKGECENAECCLSNDPLLNNKSLGDLNENVWMAADVFVCISILLVDDLRFDIDSICLTVFAISTASL